MAGQSAVVGALTDITDRKQTDEKLQLRLAELTVLHAVAMAASQSYSEDEVIKRTTQIVSGMLYPDNCGVFLLNESGTALRPDRSYWGATFGTEFKEMPLSVGVTGQVAATGICSSALMTSPNAQVYVEATPGIRSEVCVPIRVNEKIIGVLNAESRKPAAFDEDDDRLLKHDRWHSGYGDRAHAASRPANRSSALKLKTSATPPPRSPRPLSWNNSIYDHSGCPLEACFLYERID